MFAAYTLISCDEVCYLISQLLSFCLGQSVFDRVSTFVIFNLLFFVIKNNVADSIFVLDFHFNTCILRVSFSFCNAFVGCSVRINVNHTHFHCDRHCFKHASEGLVPDDVML